MLSDLSHPSGSGKDKGERRPELRFLQRLEYQNLQHILLKPISNSNLFSLSSLSYPPFITPYQFPILFPQLTSLPCCCCLVTKSCLTLCNPMDCSPTGPYVHRILQARILKWVAISSSRRSSWHRDRTHVSCTGRRILYHCSTFAVVAQSLNRVWFLGPHGLQKARLPCPSLSPRVCSNSCPLSQWCFPTILPPLGET